MVLQLQVLTINLHHQALYTVIGYNLFEVLNENHLILDELISLLDNHLPHI